MTRPPVAPSTPPMATTAPPRESTATALSGPSRGPRYAFIDLLRGFALVVMIETHVVNAYLLPELRTNRSFFWLSFFNGLVAPSFLFAAGFSVLLLGIRQWNDWVRLGPAFWRQMRRLGFITLVAYYTHLYGFRLSRYLHAQDAAIWKGSLRVDILQCVVASLLVVHALILVLRRPQRFFWGAASLGLAVALSTPFVWLIDFTKSLPLALALYLNPHGVSLFPLFPWTAFLLAGSCAGYLFVKSVEAGRPERYMRWVLYVGAVCIPVSLTARLVPFALPGYFYTTSPLYVLLRLGCVLVICAGLYRLEHARVRLLNPVRRAGQESLLVYGVHLWFIFAVLRGKHLGPILGLRAGYVGCVVWSVLTIVLMLWLARLWHDLKARHPTGVRRAQAIVVIVMIAIFAAL